MSQNYYDLLGVLRGATVDEIKKAYKKAALQHHPDKGGDSEKFKECGEAVSVLTDTGKRSSYDAGLVRTRSRDGMSGNSGASNASKPNVQPQQQQPAARPSAGGSSASQARPPRAPSGSVEIPADPSALSVKELKELLTNLGIDHDACLEKSDFLELLRNHKQTPPGDAGSSAPSAGGTSAPRPCNQPRGKPQRVKILSLGAANTGKSCLIKRYCENKFVQKYIITIGIDYGVKPVKILGQDLKINFFDTSGSSEFRDIRAEFYDNASGVVLVYDVSNRDTFDDLETWLDEAKGRHCPLSKMHSSSEVPFVILCANKVDLPRRVVPKAEGLQFANTHGMYYFETSSAAGDSVAEAMNFLFEKVANYNLTMRSKLGVG